MVDIFELPKRLRTYPSRGSGYHGNEGAYQKRNKQDCFVLNIKAPEAIPSTTNVNVDEKLI